MTLSQKRVVITGLGLVSPIGLDLETVWHNLSEGNSGIKRLRNLPTESLPFASGGEASEFTGAIEDYGQLDKKLHRSIKKNMKIMCREIEMGVAASQKALTHSGLPSDRQPERCGCIFGCDYILTRPEEYQDGMRNCLAENSGEFTLKDWPKDGLGKVNPLWLLKYLPNMPNSHVAIFNDFRGPNNAITVREASMNLAVAEAASIIQRGAADVMLVGSTGSRIHPLRTAQVSIIEQLAKEREDPGEMVRPFDAEADGTALGEGAGAIILESLEHANARNAKLWGEIVGKGSAMVGPGGSDDFLKTSIQTSMSVALRNTGERLPKDWHVHACGLGSPDVDRSESLAIKEVLDGASTPVTASKSYFGNLGSGGVAVELICSILALEHGTVFPIRNLNTPCDHVTWQPAQAGGPAGDAFLHTSFTLQGQAASVAIAKN